MCQVHTGPNNTLTIFNTVFFYIAETINIQHSRSFFRTTITTRLRLYYYYCEVSWQKQQCLQKTLQTATNNINSQEILSRHGMLSPLPAALLLYKHWWKALAASTSWAPTHPPNCYRSCVCCCAQAVLFVIWRRLFWFFGQRGCFILFNQPVTSPHKGRSLAACRSKGTAFIANFLRRGQTFSSPWRVFKVYIMNTAICYVQSDRR